MLLNFTDDESSVARSSNQWMEQFRTAGKAADRICDLLSRVSYNSNKGWHSNTYRRAGNSLDETIQNRKNINRINEDPTPSPPTPAPPTAAPSPPVRQRCVSFANEVKKYDTDGRLSVCEPESKDVELNDSFELNYKGQNSVQFNSSNLNDKLNSPQMKWTPFSHRNFIWINYWIN